MHKVNISLTKEQAKLILRLMNENDPEFDYRELAKLSVVMSDLNDIVEFGEIRWRDKKVKLKQSH
jgi:hypothetical protein